MTFTVPIAANSLEFGFIAKQTTIANKSQSDTQRVMNSLPGSLSVSVQQLQVLRPRTLRLCLVSQ